MRVDSLNKGTLEAHPSGDEIDEHKGGVTHIPLVFSRGPRVVHLLEEISSPRRPKHGDEDFFPFGTFQQPDEKGIPLFPAYGSFDFFEGFDLSFSRPFFSRLHSRLDEFHAGKVPLCLVKKLDKRLPAQPRLQPGIERCVQFLSSLKAGVEDFVKAPVFPRHLRHFVKDLAFRDIEDTLPHQDKSHGQFIQNLANLRMARERPSTHAGLCDDGIELIRNLFEGKHDISGANPAKPSDLLLRQITTFFQDFQALNLGLYLAGIHALNFFKRSRFGEGLPLPQNVLDLFSIGEFVPPAVGLRDLALTASHHGQRPVFSDRFPDGLCLQFVGEETTDLVLYVGLQRLGMGNEPPPLIFRDDGPLDQHLLLDTAHGRFTDEFLSFEQIEHMEIQTPDPLQTHDVESLDLEFSQPSSLQELVEIFGRLNRLLSHEGDVVIGEEKAIPFMAPPLPRQLEIANPRRTGSNHHVQVLSITLINLFQQGVNGVKTPLIQGSKDDFLESLGRYLMCHSYCPDFFQKSSLVGLGGNIQVFENRIDGRCILETA